MNSEFLSMNGEAGVVLRRILAEDIIKCERCGTIADEEEEECLFCKQYAFEMARDEWLEMQACTNEDPCHDYDECSWCCQHVKPCECGCGFLGGTCNEYHERLLMEAEDVNV